MVTIVGPTTSARRFRRSRPRRRWRPRPGDNLCRTGGEIKRIRSRPRRYPKATSGHRARRVKEGRRARSSTSLSPLSFWASSSPSCRRVRRRRRLADVFAGLLDDFPPTSSRAASGDCPGPPPGLPPRPPSKMDHFCIVRCIRIDHFSARSAPVPFWDLGRPGSPRAKHIVKPQRRYRLRQNIL